MNRSSWIIVLVLTAGAFAASAILYPHLPARVPIHWNIKGEVDGWGSKAVGTFLSPCIMLVMALVLAALPWLSPQQFKIDAFRSTYQYIVVVVMGLFAYIHAVILWGTAWPNSFDTARVMIGGMFLFFALLGNVMGKVKRNFYVGIRVPWTLASDRVWNETHRLAAWMWVGSSALGLALILAGQIIAAFSQFTVAVVVPIVYSFVLSKRLERSSEA